MKYSSNTVGMTAEILKRKLGAEYLVPVTIASTEFAYTDVIAAGTPIAADGTVAEDTVVGIVVHFGKLKPFICPWF